MVFGTGMYVYVWCKEIVVEQSVRPLRRYGPDNFLHAYILSRVLGGVNSLAVRLEF